MPVAILFAIWLASMTFVISSSSLGRYALTITSGDWAQHMESVESIFHNIGLPPGQARWDAQVMAGYPSLSHQVVAYTAAAADISPLQSMQVWAIGLLITGCLVVAVRLLVLADRTPTAFAIGITALYLATCAYSGLGLRSHIERNFFFPQFTGTVVALAGLTAMQRLKWDAVLRSIMIVFLGGAVLPRMHLIPAMWFTGAALIVYVLTSDDLKLGFKRGALIGGATIFLWWIGSGTMAQASDVNGWFLIRFAQVSAHGDRLAMVLGGVFCILVFLLARDVRRYPFEVLRWRLADSAGLISVCVFICLQTAVYLLLQRGSVYAIAKYSLILAVEIAVLLMRLRGPNVARRGLVFHRNATVVKLAAIVLLFICQGPFLATPHDQAPLMRIRDRLMTLQPGLPSEPRAYPQFSSLHYVENYYLAIAVMRITHDERTISWLYRATTGEAPFTWPDAQAIPLVNGGFESGVADPWSPYLSPTSAVSDEKARQGKFSLCETAGAGSMYQDIGSLQPGKHYTVTGWVSASEHSTAQAQLYLWTPGGSPAAASPSVVPQTTWRALGQTIAIGSSGTVRVHLFRGEGSGKVCWDDIHITPEE
jgi:hypothetical protein